MKKLLLLSCCTPLLLFSASGNGFAAQCRERQRYSCISCSTASPGYCKTPEAQEAFGHAAKVEFTEEQITFKSCTKYISVFLIGFFLSVVSTAALSKTGITGIGRVESGYYFSAEPAGPGRLQDSDGTTVAKGLVYRSEEAA